jgi:hypothetical protein
MLQNGLVSTHPTVCLSERIIRPNGFTLKYETSLKKLVRQKHSSLFARSVTNEEKSFITLLPDVLRALLAQYEALTLLKDLSVQADLAR